MSGTCRWDRDAEEYLTRDGEPCTAPHCRVCGYVHDDGTCPECLGSIRNDMREVARLCDDLPAETEHRGVNGEAMMLLGPSADPEALGHVEASIAAGRLPAEYLEHADSEVHPLFVLGSWDMCVRDALEHDEPDAKLTIGSAVDYLDRQLTYLGTFPHLPIEDLARDVRRCRTHLEAVLRAGAQVEKGAPCLICKRPVTRTTDNDGEVTFECERCHRRLTDNEYRLAVRAAYVAHADRLNVADLAERIRVPASTIRSWANVVREQPRGGEPVEHAPLIRSVGKDSSGRKVYRVSDALAIRDSGGDSRRSGTLSIEGVA